jgi:hypothetical protein
MELDLRIRSTGFRIRILPFFFSGFQDANKRIFCVLLNVGMSESVFKYKKITKTVYLYLFAC